MSSLYASSTSSELQKERAQQHVDNTNCPDHNLLILLDTGLQQWAVYDMVYLRIMCITVYLDVHVFVMGAEPDGHLIYPED